MGLESLLKSGGSLLQLHQQAFFLKSFCWVGAFYRNPLILPCGKSPPIAPFPDRSTVRDRRRSCSAGPDLWLCRGEQPHPTALDGCQREPDHIRHKSGVRGGSPASPPRERLRARLSVFLPLGMRLLLLLT